LNSRSNQLAHYLQKLGIGPDVAVGICLERSLEMVVGILGILKAGGAYVPLESNYPPERLDYMLEDCQAKWVLTQERLQASLSQLADAKFILLDADWEQIAAFPARSPTANVDAENLAYVMYTSGSTGIPKGVEVTHRNVLRLILPGNTYARMTADEVFLQFAPLAFDASTFEIWGSLLNGARLAVFPGYLPSPDELAQFIQTHQVTTLWLTAGLFHQMVDSSPDGLGVVRQLLAGGDVLSVPHLEQAQRQWPMCRIINGYGPTENTTFTCCYDVAQGLGMSAPIGRPIANTQVYILDKELQPLPVGVAGELYIGGDGLARGYHNQPGLTAEKFVPNPLGVAGQRLYKTGDLARYLPDGNIEFLGRLDYQVKLRGFRIELGEIEEALRQHPAVHEAIVVACEDQPGSKRLVAYVVAEQTLMPSLEGLRSALKARLPEYMLPAAFVFLDQLPLTPNGKVDRKALPAPSGERPELTHEYVAPRTPMEEALTKIWADVLGIERVGIHDNFFELGGDSLFSIRVIVRAKTAGMLFTPQQFFQHQTPAELAASANSIPGSQVEQGIVTGALPLSPPQTWFFKTFTTTPGRFCNTICVEVFQPLDTDLLVFTLKHLLAHHDGLRAQFISTEQGVQATILSPDEISPFFSVHDFSAIPPEHHNNCTVQTALELQNSHRFSDPPLLRVAYLNFGHQSRARVLICVHHLIMDGFSMDIILKDIQLIYIQLSAKQPVSLLSKTTSMKTYTNSILQYARDIAPRELNYWLQLPWERVKPLPMDNPRRRPQDTYAHMKSVLLDFGEEDMQNLFSAVKAQAAAGLQVKDFLLTALALAFRQWKDMDISWITFGHSGRSAPLTELDLSRTVGWIATTAHFLLDISNASNPQAALKAVWQQTRSVPMEGLGYELLMYLADDAECAEMVKPIREIPKTHAFFNYMGDMLAARTQQNQSSLLRPVSGFSIAEAAMRESHDQRFHPLQIEGMMGKNSLSLMFLYGPSVYRRATIEELVALYRENLLALVKDNQR
jgi:amino acid adenylation domain-containing protein/non-ribosomal peptide synthase protein (TIGR01720 family)